MYTEYNLYSSSSMMGLHEFILTVLDIFVKIYSQKNQFLIISA